MLIEVYDKHFSNAYVLFHISIIKWLKLKLFGKCYFRHDSKQGWSGKLPFYIVLCNSCKTYFLDYPHGYSQYFLCPNCK